MEHPPAYTAARQATAAQPDPTVAAAICWHAARICQALRHTAAQVEAVTAELTEHTDALIELALAPPHPHRRSSP